jgi:hypothetical protein
MDRKLIQGFSAAMTEEQRNLLDRRLRAAVEKQPEIETLRTLLLETGGVELVAPPTFDADVPKLIDAGYVMPGVVVSELMEDSGCHENVARLWTGKQYGLVGICTGYALTEDGLWRQHSWGVRQGEIIETTKERLKYFGILLQGKDADFFAECN